MDGPISSNNTASINQINQAEQLSQVKYINQIKQINQVKLSQISNDTTADQKACVGTQGYPYCNSEEYIVYYVDDGIWSVENSDWCLVKN